MPCRCSPSSGRREPPISTFLPPIEDVALAIQSVGFPHSSSATHNPTPPSSAPQAPMGDTPMHSLHFGRRPTAYVNFEWPPAHGAEGSANSQTASGFKRYACRWTASTDTPLRCSLQAANAPLAVSPPFRATSSSPPIATFSPST